MQGASKTRIKRAPFLQFLESGLKREKENGDFELFMRHFHFAYFLTVLLKLFVMRRYVRAHRSFHVGAQLMRLLRATYVVT